MSIHVYQIITMLTIDNEMMGVKMYIAYKTFSNISSQFFIEISFSIYDIKVRV